MNKFSITRQGLFITLILGCCFKGFSQTNSMGKVNIASPNAASLGKYGDIPVSYHTGVPNISIPLYTIKSGSLQMPVSLSYHASGLKVEEQDSWVGAGWTLNAGGAITRTVKGKGDEKQTSSTQQTWGYFSDYGLASIYPQNGTLLDPASYDDEPDLFFFNFNGYSGKFWFNDDRTPMLLPEQDLKIEYSYTPGQWNGSPGAWAGLGRCIESFVITTPDGTKYYFGMNGSSGTYCEPIEVSSTVTAQGGTSYSQIISSWFLNRVVSPDQNAEINLYYIRDKYAVYTFGNVPIFASFGPPISYKYELTKNLLAGVRLSSITGTNDKVDFTPGAARQDVSSWNNPTLDQSLTDNANTTSPVLGSVSISDAGSNCFKKYNFYYNYFNDNTTPVHTNFSGITSDKKRLRLDSLKEQSCDASIILPAYKFDYFTEQVRRKLGFSRDHWGYNNGVTTNTQLYPLLKMSGTAINSNAGIDIAYRGSQWPAMRAGTLNKITYPTGGSSTFDFEANTFTVNTISGTADSIVGGLRIKTISNYVPETGQTMVKNYSYNNSTGKSSGVLYGRPVYIQVMRNNFMKNVNFLGNVNGNGCWDQLNADTVSLRPYVYSDNPIRPMESTQGYHIGYGEVKVSETGNGYSIYRFHVDPPYPALINRDGVAATSITNACTCSIDTIPNYPSAPLPTDYYRGEPSYEGHFTETGSVIRDKQMGVTYEENLVTTPGMTTFSFNTGTDAFILETLYELTTAHKTGTNVIETIYQPGGGSVETVSQSLSQSLYHHEPTSSLMIDSKGKYNEKKIKYAFDYRVSTFDNTTNCYTGAASFIDYANSVFVAGNYQVIFNGCGGYTAGACYNNAMIKYDTTIWNARKRYVDCRKVNYTNLSPLNTFQANHDIAKAAANAELKPILWMQDNYVNSPIETSEWKDSKLLGATYVKYNNNRNDAIGIYPEKTQQIDLVASSASFTASTVAADKISITKDSRYKDMSLFDFNRGNPISMVSRDGIRGSYEWKYSEKLPVVKIVNAANQYKEAIISGTVTPGIGFSMPSSGVMPDIIYPFTHTQSGNINISIPVTQPNNVKLTVLYNLTGPSSPPQGYLCGSGSGAASCSSTPNSISFTNLPAGNYSLRLTISAAFASFTFPFGGTVTLTHQGLILSSSGLKEFYYQGFEEDLSATSGFAHSGSRYWPASTSVGFTKPNARNYTVQWWNFAGGKWNFNQQVYTNGMTVTGPVDDIRVFPTDAQMSTYAYNPLIGMTSQTDPNGKTTYYDYDKLGRLKNIRDNNRNITKNFFYNYGLAPKSLPALISFSANNTTAVQFDVQLTSKTSGQVFTYVVNAASNTTLGSVPPDIYDVYISRKSGTLSYLYGLCTFSASGASTTFYNVQVAAGSCSSITIN